MRSSSEFRTTSLFLVRLSRALVARFGPTSLRYKRLQPNYDHYWINDSDAVNSIDSYEATLWFLSRGDECLNCGDSPIFLPMFNVPLFIRIHKSARTP